MRSVYGFPSSISGILVNVVGAIYRPGIIVSVRRHVGRSNNDLIPYRFGPGVVTTLVSPVGDHDPLTMIQRLLLRDILFLAD